MLAKMICVSGIVSRPHEWVQGDSWPYLSDSGGFHAYGDVVNFRLSAFARPDLLDVLVQIELQANMKKRPLWEVPF